MAKILEPKPGQLAEGAVEQAAHVGQRTDCTATNPVRSDLNQPPSRPSERCRRIQAHWRRMDAPMGPYEVEHAMSDKFDRDLSAIVGARKSKQEEAAQKQAQIGADA